MDPEVFEIVFPYWIRAFGFTLAIEIPIFVLVGRFGSFKKNRIPIWRLALAGAAGSIVTHPLLWFVWPQLISNYTVYIVSGELIIALVESVSFWLIARPIKMKTAVAASFIANAISYGGGYLLGDITGL